MWSKKYLLILFAVSYDFREVDLFIREYMFVLFINTIYYLLMYL